MKDLQSLRQALKASPPWLGAGRQNFPPQPRECGSDRQKLTKGENADAEDAVLKRPVARNHSRAHGFEMELDFQHESLQLGNQLRIQCWAARPSHYWKRLSQKTSLTSSVPIRQSAALSIGTAYKACPLHVRGTMLGRPCSANGLDC